MKLGLVCQPALRRRFDKSSWAWVDTVTEGKSTTWVRNGEESAFIFRPERLLFIEENGFGAVVTREKAVNANHL